MTITNNKIINKEQPKFIFWTLLAVICLSLFLYGYFVRGAIVNIVTRQEMEKEIHALSSEVLELESKYVKAKNQVTLESAKERGFVTVSSQIFVSATQNSTSGLSVNIR